MNKYIIYISTLCLVFFLFLLNNITVSATTLDELQEQQQQQIEQQIAQQTEETMTTEETYIDDTEDLSPIARIWRKISDGISNAAYSFSIAIQKVIDNFGEFINSIFKAPV